MGVTLRVGRRAVAQIIGSSPCVVDAVSDEVATTGKHDGGPSVVKLAEMRRVDDRC